eukprot:TRINITY_DN21043_c0_g1_i1.p1 TRINITY_DN21043_c0_g1~~TRINITY_DN21043_c0_g1_i1.p1  ORF type:complete len:1110 (-),score=237.44 TRINITY_DN21043_c0_g1_i1:128-3457(-)
MAPSFKAKVRALMNDNKIPNSAREPRESLKKQRTMAGEDENEKETPSTRKSAGKILSKKTVEFHQDADEPDSMVGAMSMKRSLTGGKRASVKDVPTSAGMSSLLLESEIQQCPIFKACSQAFVGRLAEDTYDKAFGDGQTIKEAGEDGTCLYIVMRGAVTIIFEDEEIHSLGKGSYIGETMLFGLEQCWRVSLVAEGSTMVCEIDRSVFVGLLEAFPEESVHFEPFLLPLTVEQLSAGTKSTPIDIFEGLPENVLDDIDACLHRKLFFPGEAVMTAGSHSKDLVLLVQGEASVSLAGRSVRTVRAGVFQEPDDPVSRKPPVRQSTVPIDPKDRLAQEEATENVLKQLPPECFGELEFIGLNEERQFSVIAVTACHCRVFQHQMLQQLIEKHEMALEDSMLLYMIKHRRAQSLQADKERGAVLQDFINAGCSEAFLDFLRGNLEARLYPQGKLIYDAKGSPKSLHSKRSGVAAVQLLNGDRRDLEAGEVFGKMQALGVPARPEDSSAVFAVGHCCVESLHQSVVVRALEMFPDQRGCVLTLDHKNKGPDFYEILEKSAFFSNTSPEFVKELGGAATDRIFMPDDTIMTEGEVGYSMFIFVTGEADVFMIDKKEEEMEKPVEEKIILAKKTKRLPAKILSKVGHLAAGAICGELAMLGITQTRSATIIASTLCVLWEVTQEKAMAILDRFPSEKDMFGTVIVQNLNITVPGRLLQLPLFKSFDRKFRMLLTLYCERKAFFPDQIIVRENEIGDKLWILNLGPAVLQKKGFTVKIFSPGMHFGSDHMLGITKCYAGTVIAMTVCHMLAVSRSSYLLALEQYPSKEAHKLVLQKEKADAKALKEAIDRIVIRKTIWQRYQGEISRAAGAFLTDEDLLKRFLRAWSEAAKTMRERKVQIRHQRQEMSNMIVQWQQKNETSKRRAEYKRRRKDLIAKNILERGPLLHVPEEPPEHQYDPLNKQTLVLPAVPQRQTQEVVDILKAWPSPKPSSHYSLNVWSVMGEELSRPQQQPGKGLLPILQGTRRGRPQGAGDDGEGLQWQKQDIKSIQDKFISTLVNGNNDDVADGESSDSTDSEEERRLTMGPTTTGSRATISQRKTAILAAARKSLWSGLG